MSYSDESPVFGSSGRADNPDALFKGDTVPQVGSLCSSCKGWDNTHVKLANGKPCPKSN